MSTPPPPFSSSSPSHHFHIHISCPFHSPPPPPPPPPTQQHPTTTPTSNNQNPQTPNQENPLQNQQQPQLIIHYHQLSETPSTAASVTTNDAPPIINSNNPPTLHSLYSTIHKRTCNLDVDKQQAIKRKFQTLMEKFNPVPLVPSKNLDFLKHENMLKSLGLWDFVHMKFDAGVRMDLIAELVATYDPKFQCSYVKGTRITVNRVDLALAMKLPVNKKGTMDFEFSEDSKTFIVDFLSNWMLLHGGTWSSVPTEVLIWVNVIMDGHPEKVDWAGLLWFMVENELTRGEHLEACYYASHLQCLIKSQCEELFLNGDSEKLELICQVREEEEGNVNEVHKEKGIASNGSDIELTLGQDGVEQNNVNEYSMKLLRSKSDENNANLAGPSHYNKMLKTYDKGSNIQSLLDHIYQEAIQKRDKAIQKRDEAIKKRDEAIQKRDEAIKKRDEAILSLERGKQKVTKTKGKLKQGYEFSEDGTSGSNKRLRTNKYIGAYKTSSGCSWMSHIYSSKLKRYIYLGCYPNADVAARAYDAVNLWINGSKANLNFPVSYSIAYLPSDDTVISSESIKKVAAEAAFAAKNGEVKLEEGVQYY